MLINTRDVNGDSGQFWLYTHIWVYSSIDDIQQAVIVVYNINPIQVLPRPRPQRPPAI